MLDFGKGRGKEALFLVEAANLFHVVFGKLEVIDLDVFLDIIRVAGPRNRGKAFLHVPAEDNLRGRLLVLCRQFLDGLVAKDGRKIPLQQMIELAATLMEGGIKAFANRE